MRDEDDIRDYIRTFFDIVDKLEEMEMLINHDLLAIMLLYSLPASYDKFNSTRFNFRRAIESRDKLPTLETLRVKIIEEADARKKDSTESSLQSVLIANRHNYKKPSV